MAQLSAVGTTLTGNKGEYYICRQVARGGMGAIYEAEDRTNGRTVAIKEACLDPCACGEKRDQIRDRLLLEMAVLMPLDHPNIPKIYEQFSSSDNEYLVMEFIEGQTLMQILAT